MRSPVADTAPATCTPSIVAGEAARRRAFAIISHPDAGKTTLTEKLLLYGGAIAEAGAVKGKRGRAATTSDWMALERQRGISVSSSVLRFTHRDHVFNLLDTPGHRDFSEDTYRVLSAADAAVILVDAAKGIEPQTLKLFEVARARKMPLLTFINKLDRPCREPLALLDELTQTLGVAAVPMTWPVGTHGDFEGVIDRQQRLFTRFQRTAGGATAAPEAILDQRSMAAGGDPRWTKASEEVELLDAVGAAFDQSAFLGGTTTPVFFGSAVWNFGVGQLLDALIDLAPPPTARAGVAGDLRELDAPFSGLVFKVQANMDPRHRDRIAFVRVCSGRYLLGMRVVNARTGRSLALSYAHELFGRDRAPLAEAYPGDIVGIVNAADVRIGDTLYETEPVAFPPLPTLAPERFKYARNLTGSKYKQYRRGLAQLDEEGVIHVLRVPGRGDQEPILAGVGELQFEVAAHRLEHEFGAPAEMREAPFQVACRTDAEGERQLRDVRGVVVAHGADGVPLALFRNDLHRAQVATHHPDLMLDRMLTR